MIIACLFATVTQDIKFRTNHIWMDKGEWRSKTIGKTLNTKHYSPCKENIISQYCFFFKQLWLNRGRSTGYVYKILRDMLIYII